MRIKSFGVRLALMTALAGGGSALAQSASDVTLKSFDGFTQLRGELVSFDGRRYTIRTQLGTLEIDALQVTCEGDGCPEGLLFGSEFAVLGTDAISADLLPALIEGYSDTLGASLEREIGAGTSQEIFRVIHPNGEEMAAIDVSTAAAGATFASLVDGSAALAVTSARAGEAEADLFLQAGLADPRNANDESIAALDGLLVVVHPSNPIRAISLDEVARIFAGQVSNWSELGGLSRPITVYAPEAGSATAAAFAEMVMAPTGLEVAGGATRLASNADLSDAAASDAGGIAVTPFAYRRAAKVLPIRQECGILSFPTRFAVKTEEYPLSRRLYLYKSGDDLPAHARRLIDFARTAEAAPYVRDAGFVSLAAGSEGLDQQGLRLSYAITSQEEFSLPVMQEMLREFEGAERLSTTFRFTPGSSQLTAKSQREAEELARAIVDGAYDGRDVLLVGFTDSIGQFELNRALAERRAQGVLFTMAEAVDRQGNTGQFGGATIQVRGYGEMTPVGCNTSFAGRVANRRVEVWVR